MGLALEKLPDWPAGMNRELALAYCGVAEAQLREWERRGVISFRPRGPHGAMIVLRSQLDDALRHLFAAKAADPIEDMDFGDQ